jgi:hypothetical protein
LKIAVLATGALWADEVVTGLLTFGGQPGKGLHVGTLRHLLQGDQAIDGDGVNPGYSASVP